MNKRTKALQFSSKTRARIHERDGGCIFCQLGFHMDSSDTVRHAILDCMHIVNKSQGGLGIEQNGVTGCRYHHELLDNGNKGLRAEMITYIEAYMKRLYPGWDRAELVYKKGCN